jgi:hypothetical protein
LFSNLLAGSLAVGAALTTFAEAASAAPLHFRFNLNVPLTYGSEVIGGAANAL